ncbi:AI-2E family transporter [Streptococcus sp.]|nr:AI-2E family transporter [Streptococcus sp.]MDY3824238.1 AI-2E family transporter [Streptococcus sp.]
MQFDKRLISSVVLIFVTCLFIQSNWSSGATLLQTIYKAAHPFIVGAGVAFVVNIVMSAYEKLFVKLIKVDYILKFKRSFSLLLAYATFTAVVYMIFTIVLPDLITSLQSLLSINPQDIAKLLNHIQKSEIVSNVINALGGEAEVTNTLINFSKQILSQLLSSLTSILISVTSIASTLLNLVVSLIFSAYVLVNKETLGRQFRLLIDTFFKPYAKGIYYVLDVLNQRFHGFFVSQTLEAMILGSLTAIGMSLLGLPYAATIGVLISFTALIPVIGAYIGTSVGVILILTQDFKQALIFLIFIVLLQQFEGNLIYPRVVGGSIGLPGMWVLLAITLGGALGGVFGMLVAVPVSASAYQILKDYTYKKQSQISNS